MNVLVISHCLMNGSAKLKGSGYPAAREEILRRAMEGHLGILQLPCPEMLTLGALRWGVTREQLDTPMFRRSCRKMLSPVLHMISELIRGGHRIVGILGVEGSPSCGVTRTCWGYQGGDLSAGPHPIAREGQGCGVFMEVLAEMISQRGLDIPFGGFDESSPMDMADMEFKPIKSLRDGQITGGDQFDHGGRQG